MAAEYLPRCGDRVVDDQGREGTAVPIPGSNPDACYVDFGRKGYLGRMEIPLDERVESSRLRPAKGGR